MINWYRHTYSVTHIVLLILLFFCFTATTMSTPTHTAPISAIVFGSTGATGSALIHQLVRHPSVTTVTAVTRKHIDNLPARFGLTNHPQDTHKLKQLVINYDTIDDTAKHAINQHNTAFCTLGTTRAAAGSVEAFKKIDHGYVINAAQACDTTKITHFLYQSSQGANPHATFLYTRTKGEIEQDLVNSTSIRHITVLRPGLLLTGRKESRFGERIAQAVYPVISAVFPAEYRSVDVRSVAARMIGEALDTNRQQRFKLVGNGECVKTEYAADAWRQ